MNEEKKGFNNSSWWKPGIEILGQVSTWIVVPIVLALFFGKMLDNRFGTRPIIFLVFAGIGFLVTCFGMYKVVKNYLKKLEDIRPDQSRDPDSRSGKIN